MKSTKNNYRELRSIELSLETILLIRERESELLCLEKSVSAPLQTVLGILADRGDIAYFDPESEGRQQRAERLAAQTKNGHEGKVEGKANGTNGINGDN